jgi:hypothetical protein
LLRLRRRRAPAQQPRPLGVASRPYGGIEQRPRLGAAQQRHRLGEGQAVVGLVLGGGGFIGSAAAVLYAGALLEYLRASWPGGLERSFLHLHATPASFLIGVPEQQNERPYRRPCVAVAKSERVVNLSLKNDSALFFQGIFRLRS